MAAQEKAKAAATRRRRRGHPLLRGCRRERYTHGLHPAQWRAHSVPAGDGGTAPRRQRRRRPQGSPAVLPRLCGRRYHPRRGRGAGRSMRLGGGGAGERRALDPERQGGHVGSLWATLHLRQVPLRPQVRGHASGAARASDDAVEQGAVVVPPQNHLRRHQDPLAPRVLRDDGVQELLDVWFVKVQGRFS